MDTLGERLNFARKKRGYTQDSLAETIGVSRGVIFNLEKNKTDPQTIVVNAICQTLKINKNWLLNGVGTMENSSELSQSAKILAELYDVAKDLSEQEQLYLLDTVKALKQRLSRQEPTPCKTTVEEAEAEYIKSRSKFVQNVELTALNTIEDTDNKIAG